MSYIMNTNKPNGSLAKMQQQYLFVEFYILHRNYID